MASFYVHTPAFEKKMKALILKRLPRYGTLVSFSRTDDSLPTVEFTVRPTKRMMVELRRLYAEGK